MSFSRVHGLPGGAPKTWAVDEDVLVTWMDRDGKESLSMGWRDVGLVIVGYETRPVECLERCRVGLQAGHGC